MPRETRVVRYHFDIPTSVLLGKYSELELSDHVMVLFLTFDELLSSVAAPFYISTGGV